MNQAPLESGPPPTDPRSGVELIPRAQPGYYPGFSTLGQQKAWDAATRDVVVKRVEAVPLPRYFNADEEHFWSIVFEHLIPQSDRTQERRIPIVNFVDDRLFVNRSSGYRFEDMPPDREAYKLGFLAIDEEARTLFGVAFAALDYRSQDEVLKRLHDGAPAAAEAIWQHMSVHRFWQLIISDAIDAYYAHPWAWDEIGFGGPAYPRAYTRLERGDPEPWEVEEQRYDWAVPRTACSGETENAHQFHTESEQHRSHVAEPLDP